MCDGEACGIPFHPDSYWDRERREIPRASLALSAEQKRCRAVKALNYTNMTNSI